VAERWVQVTQQPFPLFLRDLVVEIGPSSVTFVPLSEEGLPGRKPNFERSVAYRPPDTLGAGSFHKLIFTVFRVEQKNQEDIAYRAQPVLFDDRGSTVTLGPVPVEALRLVLFSSKPDKPAIFVSEAFMV